MDKLYKACFLTCVFLLLTSCGGETGISDAGDTSSNDTGTVNLASLTSDADPESTTFQTLDGQALEIDALAGRKVFINYWATWCAPCIREIPSINRAAEILQADNYVFLFASDESIETIRNFLTEREFEGNFIKLNDYFGSYGIGAVPSSWLLDENGEVVKTWAGAFEWDSPKMLAELRN